jgi:hypothetical protein
VENCCKFVIKLPAIAIHKIQLFILGFFMKMMKVCSREKEPNEKSIANISIMRKYGREWNHESQVAFILIYTILSHEIYSTIYSPDN